jgi:hypothetical protein
MLTRIPDQSLLASEAGEGANHVQATRAADGSYAMVYSPSGRPFALDLTRLSAPTLRAWWWDPRTGLAKAAGDVPRELRREFTPPRAGETIDWVLILDDPSKNYPEPGTARLGR